jgi:Lon protease-like protein
MASDTITQTVAVAFAMGRIYQSAADSYARLNTVAEAATAAAVRSLVQVGPIESVSTNKLMTGNDVASQIAALIAALASGQQSSKTAGTTPPITV